MKFLSLILGGGFNPLYVAIAAAVIFGAGAVSGGIGGWKVQGWRMGTQLATVQGQVTQLKAENAIYAQANQKCGIDVGAVRKAVQGIADESARIAMAAAAAMDRAAKTSAGHLGRAESILNQPPVPTEQQCEAMRKEQRDYVETRRKSR